jgi:hypothetical protein
MGKTKRELSGEHYNATRELAYTEAGFPAYSPGGLDRKLDSRRMGCFQTLTSRIRLAIDREASWNIWGKVWRLGGLYRGAEMVQTPVDR